ncbi:nucleotidyltransferase domain-containing protein [Peribacillus simplex]|uniref:nucleotidyltransferase domain-containing protein n=1 Tax=Peribacillus simplex TaxID=1478 RepID=UPI0024C18C78|nr:nucleotidyltransferase family protein [Peribacillus simplex]WHX93858.1 nucleotidyltransferase family protein [Peribacillus simplex]
MDNNYSLDLSIIPKELRLLLDIIKTENDNSLVLKKELIAEIDWEFFLQLARHHRVYPVVYTKLNNIDNISIPKNVIRTLYEEYQKNTFQMLHLTGEMEQVSKLFTENQICLLFLKGPVIAADLYGDISQRTSKDLDILIPIDSLEKAEKLLLDIGYEKEAVPNILNEWKWRYHHAVYYHPSSKIQLEIHWRLQPLPFSEPKFNELWERKRVGSFTSYPVYFLGNEDLFLYLVSHGARHGWFRLRWLLDIDKLLRKGLDFEIIKIILKKYQNRHIVGQSLILASELLKTPIERAGGKLTEGSDSRKLAQNTLDFINGNESLTSIMSTKYYKRYLRSLMSCLQRFLNYLILLYPSSSDAKTLRLPKSFHILYFPLRPFLWALRITRKI